MHSSWLYILTNEHNKVLYVGTTKDLPTKLWEHRTKQNHNCFTARYNLGKLVYYEGHGLIADAASREKYIKGKSHKWKVELIESLNPDWQDLTTSVSRQTESPVTY